MNAMPLGPSGAQGLVLVLVHSVAVQCLSSRARHCKRGALLPCHVGLSSVVLATRARRTRHQLDGQVGHSWTFPCWTL